MTRSRWPGWIRSAASLLIGFAGSTATYAEEPAAEEEHGPVHVARDANGVVVLTLDAETQERIAIKVEAATATSLQPMAVAHGKLEQDPSQSFALRAPIAGVLRTAPGQDWPSIGSMLNADTDLGFVEPRFTPLEVADLRSRHLDALAEVEQAEADLVAARASLENKSRLNTEGGLVSDRSLEESQARFKTSQSKLEAARNKARLYESLVKGQDQVSTLFPIPVPESGEVVEISARPGEVVDAAQLLLRIQRRDVLIARLSLSLGDFVESPVAQAQVSVCGMEDMVLVGEPIGTASDASALTGGQMLLYRIHIPVDKPIRPGAAVLSHVPTTGTSEKGVIVPRSAILRHSGLTWVYVQTADDRFERRDCELRTPTAEGWFVSHGVASGEKIVVEGAQMLLSEELKSQIESEAAAGE